MSTSRTLSALAAGALLLPMAGAAAAQTPYGSTQNPYGQTQQQRDPIADILGALFGDRLGVSTNLEAEWSRGRRPLANQRASFETRLNADVRSGVLSSSEAERLRYEFDDLVQLEARYTADGRVTTTERNDLAAKYREFSQRVEAGGSDYQEGRQSVADGRTEFNTRVDASVRARRISRTEGNRLKTDYQSLIRVEADYLRDGRLTAQERDDLDARLDSLDVRVGDGAASGGGYLDNRTRLANIETAIATGERAGTLSRTEAAQLRTEHRDLAYLESAFARLNTTADESAYLTRRLGELEVRARVSRR